MKTMNLKIMAVAGLGVALFTGCESEQAEKDQDAKLAAQAKISQETAQATALAKVPGGTVKEAEIEQEKGKLIWSFDLATPGTKNITEVNVDATTGDIVKVETEAPEKD